MTRSGWRLLRSAVVVASTGTAFQLSSCTPGTLGNFVADLNPCGTILICDPLAYRFLTSGYDGPGVNLEVDPACTFPPYCGPAVDPFVGTLNGGGG
ncbi:hypothetical protein RAS1_16330 [Phycisphaerae bacterium RAS1]|nr:hypothetical protein RAS1_16330 [Phycisphaerae bacterium RAS1]